MRNQSKLGMGVTYDESEQEVNTVFVCVCDSIPESFVAKLGHLLRHATAFSRQVRRQCSHPRPGHLTVHVGAFVCARCDAATVDSAFVLERRGSHGGRPFVGVIQGLFLNRVSGYIRQPQAALPRTLVPWPGEPPRSPELRRSSPE